MSNNLSDVAVLVVDDEAAMRTAYEQFLGGMGITSVFGAEDGIAAIEVLHSRGAEIQVIVLDLRMPRMNGMEFLRHLVNVHPHPVAVVLSTAYGDQDLEETFYKSASPLVLTAEYLPKPFGVKELRAAVLHAQSLVAKKREALEQATLAGVQDRLDKVARIAESMDRRIPTFGAQIGHQVLIALILGAFVVVALNLGLDRLLSRLIR